MTNVFVMIPLDGPEATVVFESEELAKRAYDRIIGVRGADVDWRPSDLDPDTQVAFVNHPQLPEPVEMSFLVKTELTTVASWTEFEENELPLIEMLAALAGA